MLARTVSVSPEDVRVRVQPRRQKHAQQLSDMATSATLGARQEHGNRKRLRSVSFLRHGAVRAAPGAEVSVMILCTDPVIAAGLSAVLHQVPSFQIVAAPGPSELAFGQFFAEVVLADYETALCLAESTPQCAKKLVVFTKDDSEASICRALESGVSGYLLYGVRLPELIEGIRSVHAGGVALSPLASARLTNRIQGKTLTAKEEMVLAQLMLGSSNKVIASRLNLRVGTVKAHLKSILAKLGASNRTAAVIVAQRRGLLP